MDTYQDSNCYGSNSVEKTMCHYRNIPRNKFIYVKQNSQNIIKGSTILVNPRFKDNTKVFINPNFSTNAVNDRTVSRPHIYVNPKLINSISSSSNSNFQNVSSVDNRNPLKILPTDTSGKVFVSTKTKLIKVPQLESNKVLNSNTNFSKIINSSENQLQKFIRTDREFISTKNKVIKGSEFKTNAKFPTSSNSHKNIIPSHFYKKLNLFPYQLKTLEHYKLSTTKNMSSQSKKFRKHSMNSQFRYIKTGIIKKIDNSVIRSRHKIINNINTNKTVSQYVRRNSTNFRKRFIYVNKYNSSSFLANNVILRNTRQSRFININGILYQNSSSALKKTNISIRKHKDSQNSCTLPNSQLRRSIVKISPKSKRIPKHIIMGHRGRYKLVGSQIASTSKLRKSNVPCIMFKKYGKCNGQKSGTCIKVHNSDQIILCSKFLRGACLKKNCLLSHKVSPEKMPTCKFYLEGLCARDDCQYLHVKISPKADICKDFLDGFCKEGIKVFFCI